LGGHWEEPPDFRVVVDTAAGDDDAVALDGESQAILRNLALQAQRDARQAEDERRTAAEAAEQCRQRATDPSSSSAWAAELKAAADFDRDAAIAELHSVQHRALFSAVESHLGHAVVNGTLHAFKPVTLALSRTCDYCSESIGGLNRKAARCSLCDYTCHAKCQIKVVPNCQGPDPAQKSGFLSMFGSLRNKKKPSNNANSGGASHVRSASLVSEDSEHSVVVQSRQSLAAVSQASLPPIAKQMVVASSNDVGTVAVLYDFAGDGATTLTVRASDRVRVVEPDTDASGWTAVELPNGLQGMVPTSYVDMSEYKGVSSPPPPSLTARRILPPPKVVVEYVVALYDFVARDEDELSADAGQRLKVVSRDIGDGWILCEAEESGSQGRLPLAYVRSEDE
ncbi:Protein BZZ1, partial [Coemansia aciculifera]